MALNWLENYECIMMKDTILKNVIWLLFVWVTSTNVLSGYAQGKGIVEDFLNHRFGMFIHFNMGTFHGEQWQNPGMTLNLSIHVSWIAISGQKELCQPAWPTGY